MRTRTEFVTHTQLLKTLSFCNSIFIDHIRQQLTEVTRNRLVRYMDMLLLVGVINVNVQNSHGTICTTSTETQLLLHQNIEDRRHRNKPCSLQSDKLISQLNGEGIEILNSQLERETVVVWIWCRSQTARRYIQKLYESNQLRYVLYGVADIQTLTEIEQSNVITIEDNQFKKTIGKFFQVNLS